MLLLRGQRKRERMKLGTYPDLTLAKAREKAKDVLAERRTAPAAEPEARRRILFAAALATWQDTYCRTNMRPGSCYQAKRIMGYHFDRPLAKMALAEITPADLSRIFDNMTGTPAEARNAFIYLRSFLNWCVKRGYVDTPHRSAGLTSQARDRTGARAHGRGDRDDLAGGSRQRLRSRCLGSVSSPASVSGSGAFGSRNTARRQGDMAVERHEDCQTSRDTPDADGCAILDGRTGFNVWDGGIDKRQLEKRLALPSMEPSRHAPNRRHQAGRAGRRATHHRARPCASERADQRRCGHLQSLFLRAGVKAALDLWEDRLTTILDASKRDA